MVLMVLATTLCAPFATAADRALIVGVGDYAQVSDLPGIDLDVGMMQEAAERLGFREIRTLLDREATYDRFKALFERWLIDGTQSGDRVLLYFSGHGVCGGPDGDESDGKDEALILHDTRLRGSTMERSLPDDEFRDLLQRLSGRHVLVLIDAQYSGTGLGRENPSCHLWNAMSFSALIRVTQTPTRMEEEAHGRKNYSHLLPV